MEEREKGEHTSGLGCVKRAVIEFNTPWTVTLGAQEFNTARHILPC